MNISEPFIQRPVATSLLMAAIGFVGLVSFPFLPVAPLPQVDFPTIQVNATLQGASAETMAASVAAPLERHTVRPQPEHRFRCSGRSGGDHGCRQDAAAADVDAAELQEGQSRRLADHDAVGPLGYVAALCGR